ncbi:hypothetical protein IID21_04765, partial [Patescibacteria group bacterium]|nr:hypothetical protein [Patescibacteria group bacterium]
LFIKLAKELDNKADINLDGTVNSVDYSALLTGLLNQGAIGNISQEGRLSLVLTTESATLDEEFIVDILADGGQKSADGVDVLLSFDPAVISLVQINETKAFKDYFQMQELEGLVKITALADKDNPAEGTNVVASLTFKAFQEGETKIEFSLNEDDTTDSNITGRFTGRDVLTTVDNLRLNITADGITATTETVGVKGTSLARIIFLGILIIGGAVVLFFLGLYIKRNYLDAKKEEILDAYLTAWDRFFIPSDTTYNLSLEELGVTDPRDLIRIRTSDMSYGLGKKLAYLWAEQVSDRRNRMWEFRRDAHTEREVSITFIPGDANLVISTKFDFISRLVTHGGKVTTQIGDFKTGRLWEQDDLFAEVLRVQAQLMLLLAEKYTVEGLEEKVNLKKEDKDYILRNSSFSNLATVGRSMFVYRIFSKESGELQRISVLTSRDDRETFIDWMNGLVDEMYKYEAEVRALLSSNKEFKLAGVQLRKPLTF